NFILNKEDVYISEKKVELIKLFNKYLSEGGLPEYLQNKDFDYIRTIFDNILYKDIISRYSIKKQRPLKELINLLATGIASTFTYNSLKNSINLSNAITVKEYISYLNNAYLFFEVSRFDYSLKKQLTSPKKFI
ncbi:MAG: ATP-binding protein, partial [Nanoarchaeota archaeon]